MRKIPFAILSAILAFGISLSAYGQDHPPAQQVQTKVNPKDALIYVLIPPGKYQMGYSYNDSKCSNYEKPAHSVTITRGFWIGQTPVTQAAYKNVTGANPSHFKGDQLPVERITWDEAQAYCHRVGMRLPTEAEWEYAARGGNTAALYGPLTRIAWYKGNSGGTTHRVAQKQANDYGLYDMLGNVDEWVSDFYTFYVDNDAVNPLPPTHVPLVEGAPDVPSVASFPSAEASSSRVVRGASWDNDAYFVSASGRMRYDPGNRHQNVGFRCAAN
jgi:formylglycine-generating enzyme required for sulfatase activity